MSESSFHIRRASVHDAEAIARVLDAVVGERIHSAIERAWTAAEQRTYLASLSTREVFHVARHRVRRRNRLSEPRSVFAGSLVHGPCRPARYFSSARLATTRCGPGPLRRDQAFRRVCRLSEARHSGPRVERAGASLLQATRLRCMRSASRSSDGGWKGGRRDRHGVLPQRIVCRVMTRSVPNRRASMARADNLRQLDCPAGFILMPYQV